jgi:CubicO group peptidase (beta-lactamase class C family)
MRSMPAVIISALLLGSVAEAQDQAAGKLDALVAPLVELGVFSGAVAVAEGERIVLERHYGLADVEHGIPNRRETVFRIASVSKPFTRALIGVLADREIIQLDESVSRWLPALPSSGTITVRMLLDHRAGIPNINSLVFDEEAVGPNTLAALVDSITKRPLDYPPGTRRSYSNGGYAVLARLIEIAGGMSYDSLLTREVLLPLGMLSTRHEPTGGIVLNSARGYMPSPEVHGRMVLAPFQEMDTKTGGGSLVSTVDDLITWMRAIGRSSIVSDSMWTALFPAKDSLLGFQGRAPGFNAYVEHDRRRDRTTVVLANNYAAGMVSDLAAAADSIAAGRTPPRLPVTGEVKVPLSKLRDLAGFYMIPAGTLPVPPGSRIELRLVRDHLVAYLSAAPLDVLIPQGNGRFLARALWSMIEAPRDGAAESIRVKALYNESSFIAVRSH